MRTYIISHRWQLFMALISGLLLTLAFPKIDQSYLAWCALVPLLLSLRKANSRDGFIYGFAAGFVHYIGLVYWSAYCVHVYGYVNIVLSIVILVLFAIILGFFTGLFTAAVCRFCRKPWQLALLGPALWVLVEWLRCWIFTGFPWELLGYSQYARLWVIQIADIFGVLGVSALIAYFNVVLVLALLFWVEKPWQDHGVAKPLVMRSGIVLGLVLIMTIGYGIYRIKTLTPLATQAPTAEVAVIQGNVDQSHKWDASFQVLTTSKYKNLSLAADQKGADLVVWPETATPFYLFHEEVLTKMVLEGVKQTQSHYIIGSPSADTSKKEYLYYNSAYLITPRGEVTGKYDKVHLVPFGEYVPMKKWLPFLGKMVAEVGDFSAGTQGNTLVWKEHPIGMLICYEAIFPNLARAMTRNGAQLLVNITNDAWFGRTSAAYQHFSMCVLRSVENRRYLARAANTGISGFIDPCGRIISQTPLYEDLAPVAKVGFLDVQTLYTRWGDWPLVVISLGLLVFVGAINRKRS